VAACAILGSAFATPEMLAGTTPHIVETARGPVTLHRDDASGGFLLFRHAVPHRLLPNQIPFRAHALALRAVGCHALLVTSSVGVLDATVPLFSPHLLGDLLMLDNRLPDGTSCTLYTEPTDGQGHLVLQEGLFSRALSDWLTNRLILPLRRLTFLYVPGPRTKTGAENQLARALGAEVNSMTLAPEVVLANELEIPVAGLVVGHKLSVPGAPASRTSIAASLDRSRAATRRAVTTFLAEAPVVAFANHIYRFEGLR